MRGVGGERDSTKENKTTILPEHVVKVSLEALDFQTRVEVVSAAANDMKEEGKEARAEKKKKKGLQMTPEEALAMQQKMFAEARARYNSGDASGPGGPPPSEGLDRGSRPIRSRPRREPSTRVYRCDARRREGCARRDPNRRTEGDERARRVC